MTKPIAKREPNEQEKRMVAFDPIVLADQPMNFDQPRSKKIKRGYKSCEGRWGIRKRLVGEEGSHNKLDPC